MAPRAAGGPLRKGGKSLGSRTELWVHILILLCFCPVHGLAASPLESQSLCSKQGRCARVTGVPEGLGFSLTDSSVHAPSCPILATPGWWTSVACLQAPPVLWDFLGKNTAVGFHFPTQAYSRCSVKFAFRFVLCGRKKSFSRPRLWKSAALARTPCGPTVGTSDGPSGGRREVLRHLPCSALPPRVKSSQAPDVPLDMPAAALAIHK